jgi:DNA-binding response OmpR family regulator
MTWVLRSRRQDPMPSMPYRILVIDDDDDLCRLFAALLSSEGYVVDCASSVAAVRQLLATTRPDLVLCDLGIRGLADFGILALLDADAKHLGIPVLFCTGWDERVVADHLTALGRPRTALIAKPFDLDALLEAIATAVTPVAV